MYPKWFKKTGIFLIASISLFSSCKKTDFVTQKKPSGTKVIVILGSSTAYGTGASPKDSSWANKLKYHLLADQKDVKMVNLATPGYKTYNVLPSSYPTADTAKNVDKALSYKPDLIILSLPTNDFAANDPDNLILQHFSIIINKISQAKVPLILLSTQPRDFPRVSQRQRLYTFNDTLKKYFPDFLKNVYNDLATSDYFIKPVYSVGDEEHLNNKGHDLIYHDLLGDKTLINLFY